MFAAAESRAGLSLTAVCGGPPTLPREYAPHALHMTGPARLLQGEAEVVQRRGFAVPVAEFGEEGGGLLVGGDGLVEPPRPLQGQAEVVQRRGFAVPVAEFGEEGGGLLVGG